MRALTTPTKLLAYVLFSFGVVAALGLPWFGASPAARAEREGEIPTLEGPVEEFFGGVWRHVSAEGGVTGYARFEGADTLLAGLVALAVVAAALALVAGTERFGRWLMRAAALAILVVVVVKVVQVAATDDLVEARRGAVLASLCAAMMLGIALGVAQQTLRGKPRPTMTALHDPTLVRARSVAPPGR